MKENQSHTQFTFALLKKKDQQHSLKFLHQKVLVGQKTYELHEIYGAEQNIWDMAQQGTGHIEEMLSGKECVICFDN